MSSAEDGEPVGHEDDGVAQAADGGGPLVHELAKAAQQRRIGAREDAVAEVEDVAGTPAGRLEDGVGRTLNAVPRTEEQRGIEVAPGRRGPIRLCSQPSPSGMRQSRPMTSPPAAAIDSSRCDVPVPKWIVGTESPPRIRSEYGATNSS